MLAAVGWRATKHDLPTAVQDYVDKLVAPYFRAIVEWYEAIGIGVTGGELHSIIESHLGDPFFGIGLNPGHLIHLDEWLHSPIYAGSDIPLRSGMAIQVDVIPATHSPYHTTNIEDGIALADEATAQSLLAKVSGRLGSHPAPPQFHAQPARHQAQAGGAAILELARVSAAFLALAGAGDAGG